MISDYQHSLEKQLAKLKQTIARPNILLLGATGAGKSTLANLMFGAAIFEVGNVKPVTKDINYYSSAETGIGIFDSQGYELGTGGEDAFLERIVGFATTPSEFCDEQSLHICWYCIPAERERIYPIDIQAIYEIRKLGIPTAVVITKSDLLSFAALARFSKKIKSEIPPNTPIFKVAKINISGGTETDMLSEWSRLSLPSSLHLAFARAQKVKLQAKKFMALEIVGLTSAQAKAVALNSFGSGVSDEIISQCMKMTAEILYVYEMEEIETLLGGMSGLIVVRNKLAALIAFVLEGLFEVVGHLLGSNTGRMVGKVIGQMLSSPAQSEAYGKIVVAIGETVIQICSELADKAISGKRVSDDKEELREKFVTGIQKRLEI